jgi:tRNA pseudouridine55 synthase
MRGAADGSPGAPPTPSIDGVLVVDKPEGPTSHDVVARARRALRLRAVGHTGTLDPMATGVLPLVLGRATRLAQFLSGGEKVYAARIRLGVATDSWDRTGTILAEAPPGAALPGLSDVESALSSFVGEHDQVPPPFSAKKIGGVRAYDLARQGRDAPVRAVRVRLREAVLERFDTPVFDVRVACSAGFYVRALADALGRRLGCGACLDALRRLSSGHFTLAEAVPLARVEEAPCSVVIVPMERALPGLPAVALTAEGVRRALHGNDVGPDDLAAPLAMPAADAVQLCGPDGRLIAVARAGARPGVLHPSVVLG